MSELLQKHEYHHIECEGHFIQGFRRHYKNNIIVVWILYMTSLFQNKVHM